jgi:hypothetical protein
MSWTRAPEPVDPRTPVDDLEPVEAHPYREAAQRLRDHFIHGVEYIVAAHDPRKAAWVVAYAYGLPVSREQTQAAIARSLGITRQALSKDVTRYMASADLLAPVAGRTAENRQSCRRARERQLSRTT